MAKVSVTVNRSGVKALLRSAEVQADLERRAAAIAAAAADAGGGRFDHESGAGPARARAAVWTADRVAAQREATDRALLKAVPAGGR
jgi:hypothetical protein